MAAQKKYRWFFVLLFFCVATTSFAAITVSENINTNTVWNTASSPYVITNNVILDQNVTLTIEPGVEVRLDPQISMQIDGNLIAQGTESEKITFTANVSGQHWDYILFTTLSSDASFDETSGVYLEGSILEHVIIEHGGAALVDEHNGALRLNDAHPYLSHCTVRNNTASAIRAWNLSGLFRIDNCTIQDNNSSDYGGGIFLEGGQTSVKNSIINSSFGVQFRSKSIHYSNSLCSVKTSS